MNKTLSTNIFLDLNHEAEFRENGYVIIELLTVGDVEQLLRFYESMASIHGSAFAASVLSDNLEARRKIHLEISEVFSRRVLSVLNDYRIALGSFAVKQPASDFGKVGLHQDVSFVEEGERVGISLWCPLMTVNEENGYLGVVPGSHNFNKNLRESCSLPYDDLIELIEAQFMTYLPMSAGEVLFMDNRVFHGSPSNRTPTVRVVAGGVAVPRESQMVYCHRDWNADDGQLEIYEVEPDHYVQHMFGVRPETGRLVAKVPRQVTPLSESQLRARRSTN